MKNEVKFVLEFLLPTIIAITLIVLSFIIGCADETVCPAEPKFDMCDYDTWPPPPYGKPDHIVTWESLNDSTRSIIFMYDCLDSADIQVQYNISQGCWQEEETRKECIQ